MKREKGMPNFKWKEKQDNTYSDNERCELYYSDAENEKFRLDGSVSFTLATDSSLQLNCGAVEPNIYWDGSIFLLKGALYFSNDGASGRGPSLFIPANPTSYSSKFFSVANFHFVGNIFSIGNYAETDGAKNADLILSANSFTTIKCSDIICGNAKVTLNNNAVMILITDYLTPMSGGEYIITDNASLHMSFQGIGNTNYPATEKGYTLGGDVSDQDKPIAPSIHLPYPNQDPHKDWFSNLPPGFFNFATKDKAHRDITNNGTYNFSFNTGVDTPDEAYIKMVGKGLFGLNGEPQYQRSSFVTNIQGNFLSVRVKYPD